MNNNRYNSRNNNDPNRIRIDQDGLFIIAIMISIAVIIGFVALGIKISELGFKDGFWIFSKDFCNVAPPVSFFVGVLVAVGVFALIYKISNMYEDYANKNRAKFLINSNIVLTILYVTFAIIFIIAYIQAIPSVIEKISSIRHIEGHIGKIIFRYIGMFLILPFYNLIGLFENSIQLLNIVFYLSIVFGVITTLRVFCQGNVLRESDFCSYVEITYDADTGYVYNERYVSAEQRALFWNCIVFLIILAVFIFVPIIPLTITCVLQIRKFIIIIRTIRRVRERQ